MRIKASPKSEKLFNYHRSDAEMLEQMRNLGVCRRCRKGAAELLRLIAWVKQAHEEGRAVEHLPGDEGVGFRTCSSACADKIKAVMTMMH
jgi:hypothetical protein